MNPPLRIAILGAGNMCSTYLSVLSRIPDAEAVAIISRDPETAQFRQPGFTGQWAVSLADISSEYDAVIVTTPNGLHGQAIAAAAALGKHVLTEKSLEITTTAMEQAIAACRRAGVKLAVAYQRRMSPDNQCVKHMLDHGELGRVLAADLTVKYFRDQAYYDSAAYRGTYALDGGGPFMQQAAHNIDLYGWFFGRPRNVVSMLGRLAHRLEAEDHGTALLYHAHGMLGRITASTCCRPGFPAQLDIHTDRGSVSMVNDVIDTWLFDDIPNPARTHEFAVHSGAATAAVEQTAGHEAIVSDFVDAIRNNRPPAISGEDARLATELILEIYAANILGDGKFQQN